MFVTVYVFKIFSILLAEVVVDVVAVHLVRVIRAVDWSYGWIEDETFVDNQPFSQSVIILARQRQRLSRV